MSKETEQAVEDALRAHMADEHNGAYLTQYAIVAHAIDSTDPDASYYGYMNHDGPPHEWMGLSSMLERRARHVQWRHIGYEENQE